MNIIIFSRPIHSGKTTELMQWCKMQKRCLGILMPDVDGVRKIYDIEEQFYFDAECKNQSLIDEGLLKIGKYSFYQSAFDKANNVIEKSIFSNPDFIVIDEVGMLELAGKGFYKSIKLLLEALRISDSKSKIILVVRDVFTADVVTYFNILNYKIVDSLTDL